MEIQRFTSGFKDLRIEKLEFSFNQTLYLWDLIARHTGLPTKDETLDSIVRNLYCLFPYIYDSLQLYICNCSTKPFSRA